MGKPITGGLQLHGIRLGWLSNDRIEWSPIRAGAPHGNVIGSVAALSPDRECTATFERSALTSVLTVTVTVSVAVSHFELVGVSIWNQTWHWVHDTMASASTSPETEDDADYQRAYPGRVVLVQFVIAAAPQDLGLWAVCDISVAAVEIDVSESRHSVIASDESIARIGRESVCR